MARRTGKDFPPALYPGLLRFPADGGRPGLQSSNTQTHEFIGLVKSYDEEKGLAWVEQRNHFKLGQTVEFLQPKGQLVRYTIDRIVDEDGQDLDAARHAQQLVGLAVPQRLEPYSMMRRQVKSHV